MLVNTAFRPVLFNMNDLLQVLRLFIVSLYHHIERVFHRPRLQFHDWGGRQLCLWTASCPSKYKSRKYWTIWYLELVVAFNLVSSCRRDKHAEALEVEYLVEDLVEAYSQALPQVSWGRLRWRIPLIVCQHGDKGTLDSLPAPRHLVCKALSLCLGQGSLKVVISVYPYW